MSLEASSEEDKEASATGQNTSGSNPLSSENKKADAEDSDTSAISDLSYIPPPPHVSTVASSMLQVKIRPFFGLRDGKENPEEYIEDIKWAYDREIKPTDPTGATADKSYRMLFRQHLEKDAHDWYTDLESDVKQNWESLRNSFLTYYKITVKDAQAKKFELGMKLAQLKQDDKESIADYLKKASDISRKLPNDEIDVGMATLQGMRDRSKREQVNFKCNKDSDYTFPRVERLIKAAYSEV